MTNLLSYYDSRLLADAITVPEKILLTFNVPWHLVKQVLCFTLFEATLIPMPYPKNPQVVLIWNVEAPHFAFSEDQVVSLVFSSL